ncbi:unnamed protein product [Rotaria magnacalcarata]|uniref:Uncharacterized protein n=1 Tax=Rotaria magnacalcarata TaxID=392030 RepID=A0A8S2PW90_9BILA|nr:unnamed protein product [Rotaria magnacalcarata]
MIARSQKWTGVFQADSKCDANACCCITGNKLATNYSTNTLEVVSDMIGLCQGVKILSTTCPYPNDCNDYVTVFNQNVALELNSDSSTIAFNNPNNPMLSIRPHHSGLDLFSGQSADVASHEFKSDTFLRVAMSVLPVAAVLSYQIDAIWQLQIRNMYAGLSSTILHIFYFLQFYIHLKDNLEQLKICILHSKQEEQSLTIESLNIDSKIHLCSLDDGTIFIGYNSKIFSLTNEQWSLDSKIIKMCSGKEHVLVLLADGRILSWGNGLHGALGLGDLEPSLQPTQVESLSNDVIDIAAGGWHSLVLLADGSAMSWGWNNDGALGLDTSDEDDIAGVFCDPTLVTCLPLDIDCKYVSAGARHSAFIGSNDYVWLCGSNKHGQLGTPSSFSIEKGTIVHCLSWFTLLISQGI